MPHPRTVRDIPWCFLGWSRISYGGSVRIRMFSFNLCSYKWFVIWYRAGKKQSNESVSNFRSRIENFLFGSILFFSYYFSLFDMIFLGNWFFISILYINADLFVKLWFYYYEVHPKLFLYGSETTRFKWNEPISFSL